MCTLSVSNVIYHKFSHGAAFCTLNGKNVNVMLECLTKLLINRSYIANVIIYQQLAKFSVYKNIPNAGKMAID